MSFFKVTFSVLCISLLLTSCNNNCEEGCLEPQNFLNFEAVEPQESNIWFENEIRETEKFNYYTFPYIYGGGGVAVGDLNNDGLPDIYFAGNIVKNCLYINQGDFKFADITSRAGVGASEIQRWVTGVTMADVNNDGWLDIYVCASGPIGDRKNLLYINNGDYTFTEEAEKFGLADTGFSSQSVFFDYDRDGDLDVYICAYPPSYFQSPNQFYVDKQLQNEEYETDRLYRNDGNKHFTDVTKDAGVRNFGLTLNASVSDFNADGWPDIYVSNDFNSADFYYVNNGDGTFSEQSKTAFAHTSNFGMGSDAADINNDGLIDLFQLDMMSETNEGKKKNMSAMSPETFTEAVDLGLHYQYMKNTLQLNNGNNSFSDVSELSGVANTNWSWSTLLSDLNNDGWKDIFVTNGIIKSVNDNDYNIMDRKMQLRGDSSPASRYLLLNRMPVEPVNNYVFVNNGDLTFSKINNNDGLTHSGFSHGAAYADFDGDGDLDMVINNMDMLSLVYKNNARDSIPDNSHYLKVRLEGTQDNTFAIGSKVTIITNGERQYQELFTTRGYQSSVGTEIHFGVGKNTRIDEVEIIWPNGQVKKLFDVKADKVLKVKQENGTVSKADSKPKNVIFEDITATSKLNVTHQENDYNDFIKETLLPHKMSQQGPALSVGDINGDGLDDFFVGGAKGVSGQFFIQQQDATFIQKTSLTLENDLHQEDVSSLLFDADKDGDLDLYVVSGGNEEPVNTPYYQDRLYINDGKGNYKKNSEAIPVNVTSGSIVKAADYDNDGDLDLFVGGRQIPEKYPFPANSYLLENNSTKNDIKFVDVTNEQALMLKEFGMVTDASWTDFNGDNKIDLVVVGEWMTIKLLKNNGNGFEDVTKTVGLENTTGWWNSIAVADMDNDGDQDFIAGNLGLNYKYKASKENPFEIFSEDFDDNGINDIILGYYEEGNLYPVRGRSCTSSQMPYVKKKFPTYEAFGNATINDVLEQEGIEKALHYKATTFASTYFRNDSGKFTAIPLENYAQISSINSIYINDFDADGYKDIIVAGNLYESEVETPRNDASYGLYLKNDGKGNFKAVPSVKSGLLVKGETREIVKIKLATNENAFIIARNEDTLKIYVHNKNDGKGGNLD